MDGFFHQFFLHASNSQTGRGLEKIYPCTVSQWMVRRKAICSGVSIPSAAVWIPSFLTSSTKQIITFCAFGSAISRKNFRSSLMASTSNSFNRPNEEKPVPKSSREHKTPAHAFHHECCFSRRELSGHRKMWPRSFPVRACPWKFNRLSLSTQGAAKSRGF